MEEAAFTYIHWLVGPTLWRDEPKQGWLNPNGGRTLIVAAGAKRFRDYLLEGCEYSYNGESYEKTCAPKGNIVLDDVHEFDVETS
ncbi:hypothetical protein BG000_006226, partial [Podila horticola]